MRRTWWVFAVVLHVAVASADTAPTDMQKYALYSKPSVVRVVNEFHLHFTVDGQPLVYDDAWSGTGWFITPDGYIATNAHVADAGPGFDDTNQKNAMIRELAVELKKRIGDRKVEVAIGKLDKSGYVILPNGDHLNYEGKIIGVPNTGHDCAIIKVKTENAPALKIGDSSKSEVQDRIIAIGYPGLVDDKVGGSKFDDKSHLEATITDGTIEAVKRTSEGDQILQISAPIFHGNSGGPAIDQNGAVVGLATFGAADSSEQRTIQGFNFLVASSTLKDYVEKAKIENKEGDTSARWRSGLDHYWANEYTAAIKDFEEVATLFPAHSEAAKMIVAARQAQKDGKEKKSDSTNTGLIVGVVAGVVLLIGVAIWGMSRSKRRGAPPMRPGMLMQGPPMPMPMQGRPMPGMPMANASGPMPYPQMMAGAVAPHGVQQVAKTVAVNQPPQRAPVAPTAFAGSAIGSLTCVRGRMQGERFALGPQGLLIGRQPGVAQVVIDDHRVSGKHVWIGIERGQLVCIDQTTTNGTFVNDIQRGRVSRAELRDGDVVIVVDPDLASLQIKFS